jgi:hypothetical protein
MKRQNDFLVASAARLAALIEDQERLLEIIRREKRQLVRVDPSTPSALPTPK